MTIVSLRRKKGSACKAKKASPNVKYEGSSVMFRLCCTRDWCTSPTGLRKTVNVLPKMSQSSDRKSNEDLWPELKRLNKPLPISSLSHEECAFRKC